MKNRALSLAMIAWSALGAACGDDANGGGADAGGSAAAGTGAAGRGAAGTGGAVGTAAGTGGGGAAGGGGEAGGGGDTFTLTSSAFMDGGMLPAKYRCQGSVGGPTGPSPALGWTGAPAGTMSFAVLLRDRTYMNYQHWTIYDIPASVMSLPEMVPTGASPAEPAGAKQANNSAGLTGPGYYGPCGATGVNMYEFTVYALDVDTLPMPGTTGDSVQAALEMHDLAKASLLVMSGR
jgi:Raf kinase inhibitor-like YbhB/YbcL family protein